MNTACNSLKRYVREYINDAAADYGGNIREVLHDATQGVDSGWWTDLIYVSNILDLAKEHAPAIAEVLAEYRDAVGESYVWTDYYGKETITSEQILIALLKLREGAELSDDERESAMHGVKFAVEWFANEIASELCHSEF